MVKNFYRTVTFAAAAGLLSLLDAPPVQVGAVNAAIEKNAPVRPEVSTQAEGQSDKQRGPQSSAFIALSGLILETSRGDDTTDTAGLAAFDPAVVDRILSSKPVGGETGRIRSGHDTLSPGGLLIVEPQNKPVTLTVRPLTVGKSSSPFKNFVTAIFPHSMVQWIDNMYAPGEMSDFAGNSVFKTDVGSKELQGAASDNTAKGSKSPFKYSYKADTMSLNTGITWISDLADTRGLSQTFQKAGFDSTADKVHGVNLNLGATYRSFSLTGGYIRALERYGATQPSFAGNDNEPGAWSSELSYATELLRKEAILTVGYQKASESLKSYLPEQRYVTRASMAIFDGTTLILEYYRDRDYSVENGGANGDGYGIATKLGFEFQVGR